MSKRRRPNVSSTGEPEIVMDDPWPWIEPGEYIAICSSADYSKCWGGQQKLFLKFTITEGKYADTKLFLACNADSNCKKPNHKLFDLWCISLGRRPEKGERFNKNRFLHRAYSVLVRTTQRRIQRTNRLRPDYAQYSVVDTLIEARTGIPMSATGEVL